jgi:D-glycero-D-manno-heptose 1,7-bisphosphate phosphatase
MSLETAWEPGSAVFLDRDGTLIEEVDYLERVEQVALYSWSIDGVRLLNRAGIRVFVVTNQAGVARGYFAESVVADVHRHIDSLLASGGAKIDAYYYCPHHPEGAVEEYRRLCDCRKPGRGLVDRAAREFGIDPAQSFVVGDRWLDIQLARAVGAHGVLVRTGFGSIAERQRPTDVTADAIADNLLGAAKWILGRTQAEKLDHNRSQTS